MPNVKPPERAAFLLPAIEGRDVTLGILPVFPSHREKGNSATQMCSDLNIKRELMMKGFFFIVSLCSAGSEARAV